MTQNPLHQYFRQPKIFLKLPSLGKYNSSSSITGDVDKMPIFGMSGMDQIIVKTPDALLNGESTVRLIQSCCPNILDGWEVTSIDIDSILVAIKIATYGNKMSIDGVCSNCNTENSYDIDLVKVLEYFNTCSFNSSVVIDDLVIKLKPLPYKLITSFSLENFSLQKQLIQISEIENVDKKQELLSKVFTEFASLQSRVIQSSIEYIETPTSVVSEYGYIKEWVDNCDQSTISEIKNFLDKNGKIWKNPPVSAPCANCGHVDTIELELDQSSFFDNA